MDLHLKILALAVILSVKSFAQSTDPLFDVRSPSPEASNLGEYVERPVSYFTGTPQISIPIHTVKIKDFELPISLSYHASGIRVDEIASNVGLGWTLNAGGTIIKVPDQGSATLGPVSAHYPGDFCNFYPNVDDQGDPDYQYALNVTENNSKTEPDLFNYNFLGNTGKFIRDPINTDSLYAIPLNNFQISYAPSKYTILDERGIKYEFGVVETSDYQDDPLITTSVHQLRFLVNRSFSFYLSKISLPTGEFIDLEYESNNYSYVSSLKDEEYQPAGSNFGCSIPNHSLIPIKVISSVSGSRLKAIKAYGANNAVSPFMHVNFSYDQHMREDIAPPAGVQGLLTNESKALKSIEVHYAGNSNNPVQTFNLNHQYTTAGNGSGDAYEQSLAKRLWLTSVEEVGKAAYRFDYNHDNPLPKRLSYGQDYYGYYNGITTNPSMIPNTVPVTGKGANRTVNYVYAQSGMLQKLTYPTGGYTLFEFEGNEGGAGLRLLSQKSYDHDQTLEKEHYYTYEEMSGNQTLKFHDQVTIYELRDGDYPEPACSWHRNTTGAVPALSGRHQSFTIGYGKVTEWNGAGGKGGKIVYEFHQNIGGISSSLGYSGAPVSYDWVRGLPFRTTYYAKDGSDDSFKKVKELNYHYQVTDGLSGLCDTSENLNLKYFDVYQVKVIKPAFQSLSSISVQPALFEWEQYKVITNWYFRSSVEEKTFPSDLSEADSISTRTTYGYDPVFKVMTSSLSVESDGDSIETIYKHPVHYDMPLYDKMSSNTNHIYFSPIETQQWNRNNNTLISSSIMPYIEQATNVFVPNAVYGPSFSSSRLNPTGHDSRTATIWNTDLFEKRASFVHNDFGNLVQQRLEGGMVTSYIWGYNQTLLVAEIQNVPYDTIISQLGQSALDNLSANLSPAQLSTLSAIQGAYVTHFEYESGNGISKITDPNGRPTTYMYDPAGRLVQIQDHNGHILTQYTYHYKK